jgi:hypothetical protein
MPLARSGVATHVEVRLSAPRPNSAFARGDAAARAWIGEASSGEMRAKDAQRGDGRGLNRRSLLVGLALGLVAAGVVLVFNSGGNAQPTRSEYLRRANAICTAYGRRLDRIPPPLDPASPGTIYESIGLALPLLREQSAKVRALAPPNVLRANVDRFFAHTDRSLDHLQRARQRAGRRELFPMVQSLSAFGKARDAAKREARSIGFKC